MTSEELRQRAASMVSDGMSYREVAEKIGVSHTTIGNWLNKKYKKPMQLLSNGASVQEIISKVNELIEDRNP